MGSVHPPAAGPAVPVTSISILWHAPGAQQSCLCSRPPRPRQTLPMVLSPAPPQRLARGFLVGGTQRPSWHQLVASARGITSWHHLVASARGSASRQGNASQHGMALQHHASLQHHHLAARPAAQQRWWGGSGVVEMGTPAPPCSGEEPN